MSRDTDTARRTGPALEATYRFLLWLVPTVEKFPRSQKFLLGDRIQTTAFDVPGQAVEGGWREASVSTQQYHVWLLSMCRPSAPRGWAATA